MGSSDIPPPHVSSTYHATTQLFLGAGGIFWTTTYVLIIRQSLRDRTYSMPLFALACNFAWEFVICVHVADAVSERVVYGTWLVLDVGLIYTMMKYGQEEWKHATIVARNVGKIFLVSLLWWSCVLWTFCDWWLDEAHPVNPKPGKFFRGIEGPDTTELAYWSALVAQVVLSISYLAQIITRGHSGGTTYTIWAIRFNGSLLGLNGYMIYSWYAWPEAHEYVVTPFSLCLMATWVVADIAYLAVLLQVKAVEIVRDSGRKTGGNEAPRKVKGY